MDDIAREMVIERVNKDIDAQRMKRGLVLTVEEQSEPLKYVMYLRRSTKGTKHQQRSIEDQESDCIEIMKDKKLLVVDIIRESKSARVSSKRSEFDQMLEGIKKKKYNAILAWHPDRLARNMKDAGEIIDLLDKGVIRNLKFKAYDFTNDSNGKMALGIQFVLAKQYSDNLSAVIGRGGHKKAARGESPSRTVKPGYSIIGSQSDRHYFRPDGDEWDKIRYAFDLGLRSTPYRRIAEEINKQQYKSKGKVVKVNEKFIYRIFRDSFYCGYYVYGISSPRYTTVHLQEVDPKFKPMLSYSQFLKLSDIRSSRSKLNPLLQGKRIKFPLFRGMCVCSFCGNLMTPSLNTGHGGRYFNLACTSKQCLRHIKKTDNNMDIKKSIRAHVLFEYIDTLLKNGLEIDKKLYDEVAKETLHYVDSQIDRINGIIATHNNNKQNYERLLSKATDHYYDASKEERPRYAKDKEVYEKEISKLKGLIDGEKDQIVLLLATRDTKFYSYETFSNYLTNINTTIQNTENINECDQAIRTVFSNLVIGGSEVLSYQLNPTFEPYVKIRNVYQGGR